MARTELIVCTTCRDGRGQALLEQVENEALAQDLALPVRGVACMSGCSRGCTAAVLAAGKLGYLFGELQPDAACAQALIDVARQHAAHAEGQLAWAQRPEALKGGLLARLPPPLSLAAS